MLVTISDLHLNDGTVCKQTSQSSARLFFDSIKIQAEKARLRLDGSSKPIDQIDVVMNGDIFDFIRSDRWFNNSIRPWDAPRDTADTVLEITQNIIENNKVFLETFRNYSENGILLDGDTDPTPVNVHYLVGNHDWFLLGRYRGYLHARKLVADAFGLKSSEFQWEIERDEELFKLCLDHQVYIRHGDMYDDFNYHEFIGRMGPSIGDAIAIELVTNFPNLVKKMISNKFPDDDLSVEFCEALEELDNIRPSSLVPVYINNIIKNITPKKHKSIVRAAFKQCTKNIELSEIYKYVKDRSWFTTLKLKIANFLSQISPSCVIRIVAKITGVFPDVYQRAAAKEHFIKSGECKYVVYGHTHVPAMKGIGITKNKKQIYFNSSTWRPIHEEIPAKYDGLPYFTHNTMTWVAFYKDGERKGREYEVWTGALDER